jgi:hypothetical protein
VQQRPTKGLSLSLKHPLEEARPSHFTLTYCGLVMVGHSFFPFSSFASFSASELHAAFFVLLLNNNNEHGLRRRVVMSHGYHIASHQSAAADQSSSYLTSLTNVLKKVKECFRLFLFIYKLKKARRA